MKSIDSAAIFKALADENRVEIVRCIARNPGVTASSLLDRLDIAQSTLSHHMKVLIGAGIVTAKRKGKWTHYSINLDAVDRLERCVTSLRTPRSLKVRAARRGTGVEAEPEPAIIPMDENQDADVRRVAMED